MIYSFMYAYFYQLSQKLRSNDSKFYSGSFATVGIMFHLLLLGAILKAATGDHLGYQSSKYVFLPVVLFLIWILERAFKKYGDEIIRRYEHRNLLSPANALIVTVLVFGPLVISIMLLRK